MENKIKIGICDWALPPLGPYLCKIAADFKLDGLYLDFGSYSDGFHLSYEVVQRAYLEASDRWGIELHAIAMNDLCINGITSSSDFKKREIAKNTIISCIKSAEALKVPIVYFPSMFNSDIENEEDFQLTVDGFKQACRYAEDKGIVVCTENLLSAEDNLRLLNQVDCKNLKILFDTQNPYYQKGFYVPDMIRKLKDNILEVHVKDGQDQGLSSSLLGKGKTDFYESIKAFKEINYSGWLTLENYYFKEPLRNLNDNPFELLKQDTEILKDALEKEHMR